MAHVRLQSLAAYTMDILSVFDSSPGSIRASTIFVLRPLLFVRFNSTISVLALVCPGANSTEISFSNTPSSSPTPRLQDGGARARRTLQPRVGIHGCRNCIYDRKIYDSVVDLLMKLAQFWYFGHVSKSLVAKSTTAMNPNPGMDYGKKDRKR